jgi:hypothetical protein
MAQEALGMDFSLHLDGLVHLHHAPLGELNWALIAHLSRTPEDGSSSSATKTTFNASTMYEAESGTFAGRVHLVSLARPITVVRR